MSVADDPNNVYRRQLGIFNPEDYDGEITILGLGATGSAVALVLTKLGIRKFKLYDFDSVEPHNLPNQIYLADSIGKPKVEAARDVMMSFDPTQDNFILTYNEAADENTKFTSEIVVIAVDSRDARLKIWESLKNSPDVKLVLDPRMGGEAMRLYTINMEDEYDLIRYEESMKGDVARLPCTERSIIYNIFALGSLVGSCIKKYIKGEELPRLLMFDIRNFVLVNIS